VSSLTSDGAPAPELDSSFCCQLKASSEILGLFPFEGMELMDWAINDEVLITEESITLSQELEREIQIMPTLQLSWIKIATLEVPIFWLRGGEYIGLVFRLKDEEFLAVVLQEMHFSLLALLGIFGDVHGRESPAYCG
jgi:hypothetical protein